MAEKPLSAPLPADLPEDWTDGQIVVPYGPGAGLSEQHGYNYLMAAVNAAHRAVNAVNDGFGTISGKRTARFTVGTASAGWTEADCDYLCDGLDDQEQLNAACGAAESAGGGEVILLSGRYYLTGTVAIPGGVTLRGNGAGATVLAWEEGDGPAVTLLGTLIDLECESFEWNGYFIDCPSGTARIGRVSFSSVSAQNAVRCGGGELDLRDCVFAENSAVLISALSGTDRPMALITGCLGGLALKLDGVRPGSVVSNNRLERLELANTSGAAYSSWGCLVCGNVFSGSVTLGAGTRYNFVTGNLLTNPVTGAPLTVTDQGTDNVIRFNSGGQGGSLITYGAADLTPGVSSLPDGTVYLVYE